MKAPQNLDQMSCLEAGKDPDELPAKKNSVLKVTQDSWETTANSLEISVNSMPAVVNGMEKMLPCKETIRVMNTVVYNLETSINKEEIKVNGPEESVSCLETYAITNGLKMTAEDLISDENPVEVNHVDQNQILEPAKWLTATVSAPISDTVYSSALSSSSDSSFVPDSVPLLSFTNNHHQKCEAFNKNIFYKQSQKIAQLR